MSLNAIITQSPILLFLGAGASVPLGKPTMEQFVRRLIREITSENEASLLSVVTSARGHDLEAILIDLETFLSLEYVASFAFARQSVTAGQATRDDAASLRSLIRHAIIREYRSIDMKRAIEVYGPLFDTIFSHIDSASYCLPVFTTNYDLAIESFCGEQYAEYDFIDGMESDPFQRQACWNPGQFESFRIDRPVRGIVLFKLHGSVNWMRITSSGQIVQSLPMYDVIDSDQYQNTIIYPAGNKVATSEPYLTGYHYFGRCCESAKVILAIGYSFRDYDALSILLRARQLNEDLKLILLSPRAYHVLETIPDEDRIFWARAIYGYFGDKASEAKYLEEIDELIGRYLKKAR